MIDVWIGNAFIVIVVAWSVLSGLLVLTPRLKPGPGIHLHDFESLQVRYEKLYKIFIGLRIVCVPIAIYFLIRVITWSGAKAPGPTIIDMIEAVIVTFAVSYFIVVAVSVIFEHRFFKEHPEFADSALPFGTRLALLVPSLLGIGLCGVAPFADEMSTSLTIFGCGFVIFSIAAVTARKLITQRQFEIPWSSELGMQVAELLPQFNFQPKKFILLPSTMANGFAMADGTVIITTALRTLLTKEEVSAILAHELSHVRDGEGKKLDSVRQWASLIVTLPIVAGVILGIHKPFEAFMPALTGSIAILFGLLNARIIARISQPMEFKCDRDAALRGLGQAMSSALDKIHRYQSLPYRWIGLHKKLLTHPSLEDRQRAIASISPPLLTEKSGALGS